MITNIYIGEDALELPGSGASVQVVTVTESRDLLASDLGNMLVSDGMDTWDITTVDVGEEPGAFFYTAGLNVNGGAVSAQAALFIAHPAGSWYQVVGPAPSSLVDSAGDTVFLADVGSATINEPLTLNAPMASAIDMGENAIENVSDITFAAAPIEITGTTVQEQIDSIMVALTATLNFVDNRF